MSFQLGASKNSWMNSMILSIGCVYLRQHDDIEIISSLANHALHHA